jgi:hypothetical protein
MFSAIRLQPSNLASVLLCQVLWGLIAGALMLSGGIEALPIKTGR